MKKMLYFRDAADTTACFPAENLLRMATVNGTTVVLNFKAGNGNAEATAGGVIDLVTITLATADKELELMQDITNTINGHPHASGLIVIADDVTGTFCSTQIASIATTLDT